jgi:hypothetical protein
MTNHPITPSPKIVDQLFMIEGSEEDRIIAAYRAGADQELEACCAHMRDHQWGFVERPDGTKIHRAVYLQQSRRPKPPSLKEQALNDLDDIPTHDDEGRQVVDLSNIRRALEALDD